MTIEAKARTVWWISIEAIYMLLPCYYTYMYTYTPFVLVEQQSHKATDVFYLNISINLYIVFICIKFPVWDNLIWKKNAIRSRVN